MAHNLDQAAAGMMILLVDLEMLGEFIDALGEERNLNLRRPCIRRVRAIGLDQSILALRGNQRDRSSKCARGLTEGGVLGNPRPDPDDAQRPQRAIGAKLEHGEESTLGVERSDLGAR